MADLAGTGKAGRGSRRWRIVAWGLAALLLLLPAVAMQFTSEVNWTAEDFIFAGIIFGVVGLTYEVAVRMTRSWAYRGGVAAALAGGFMILWANGAVGMIGDEGERYSLLFYLVIPLALAGAIVARFRSAGMVWAMLAAAIAQAAIGVGGYSLDPRGAVFSTGLAGLWLLAAGLFALAARQHRPVGAG